ncbi:MAG: hypothetical protein AB7Q16_11665 [Vicinamibacterales bacterium]
MQQPPSSLVDQVQALTERLAVIEARLAALEARGPAPAGEPAAYDILPAVAVPRVDALRLTTALGRSFIVLGGAFLLRALTDGGTWPPGAGVTLGLVYALSWMALSDRAAGAGDRVRAIFDGGTAFIIGFPLVGEATLRFGLFTPEAAAVVLTAFTAAALVVAYRAGLQTLAWMGTVGGMVTGLTLMVRLGVVAPYSIYFTALGVGTLWLGYLREWKLLRWPTGLLAAVGVLGVTSRALSVPPADTAASAWAAQGLLVVGYFASVAIRTLIRGRQVIVFEVAQTVLVLLVGVGGAVMVSRSLQAGGATLGLVLALLGAVAYLVSFRFMPRDARGALNFYFYSSLAIVFALTGVETALGGAARALALSGFAALLAVAWSRTGRVTLGGHAAVALSAAAVSGGLMALFESAFAGEFPVAALLWTAGVTLAVALLVSGSHASEAHAGRFVAADIPALGIGLMAVIGTAAFLTLAVARALEAVSSTVMDAGTLATVRTAVLSAMAIGAGLLDRPGRFSAIGRLAYPLLALTGLKLALVDLRASSPATLFVALACYGVALVMVARLRRVAAH